MKTVTMRGIVTMLRVLCELEEDFAKTEIPIEVLYAMGGNQMKNPAYAKIFNLMMQGAQEAEIEFAVGELRKDLENL